MTFLDPRTTHGFVEGQYVRLATGEYVRILAIYDPHQVCVRMLDGSTPVIHRNNIVTRPARYA